MRFNKKEFISFFIKNNGVSFFDNTSLSQYSGKPSSVYFNWRTATEKVSQLDKCAEFVIKFVLDNNIKPDCFVGVPEGAIKLAVLLQYKWNKEYKKGIDLLPLIRTNPKTHGAVKDRKFLGLPRGRIVLIEDVVARGGGIKKTLIKLKKAKIKPYAIIVLSDRMKKKHKKPFLKLLKKQGIKFYALTNNQEVIEQAVEILKPSKNIIDKLREIGYVK